MNNSSYPGADADLAAHAARQEAIAHAASVPLPGAAGKAFAVSAGIACTAGHVAILQQLGSPVFELCRAVTETANDSSARATRISAVNFRDQAMAELVYVSRHTPAIA
jgi:hypothetical protein